MVEETGESFLILVFKKLFSACNVIMLYNSVSERDIHRKLMIIVLCWLFKLSFYLYVG